MMAALARESLAMPGTDDQRKAMFDDRLRRELRRHMDETQAQSYESAAAFGLSWAGLARYLPADERRAEARDARSVRRQAREPEPGSPSPQFARASGAFVDLAIEGAFSRRIA